jgi:hypothetical protein
MPMRDRVAYVALDGFAPVEPGDVRAAMKAGAAGLTGRRRAPSWGPL